MANIKWTSMLTLAAVMSAAAQSPSKNQRTITVSSFEFDPYLKRQKVNDTWEYDGYIEDVLGELSKIMGVTFTIRTNSAGYGKQLPNGSWTGIIGDVLSKRADLGAASLTVTAARRTVVGFTVPFQNFGPVIVMRRPTFAQPSFQERFQRLFAPLSHSVWLMSLVAYFITSVILYIICHFNPYEWRQLYREKQATLREAESFTCMNAFWFVLSTWMWQGYVRAPRSLGGRLVVTFWWLFVVLFLLTYTASLTNLLRTGPTPLQNEQFVRILSLEDLTKQRDVDYGFLSGGSTEEYFKNAQVPYLRRVYDDVKKTNNFMASVDVGIEKIRNSLDSSPFAFVMESAMANYRLRQKPCDLYMVGDVAMAGSYAFAYRPGWDLADEMDLAILRLKENGLFKLLEEKWFRGECENNVLDPGIKDKITISSFYSVTLGGFSGALVILIGGVFAGCIVTIIEIIIFRKAELATPSEEEASLPMKGDGTSKSKGDSSSPIKNADSDNITDV